jgi:putative ABC transport system permease protein
MTLLIAFKALGRNKLRTALTMLGMIIGVAAVICMVALGTGAQAQIEASIMSAGTNLITVSPGSSNGPGGARTGFGGNTRLIEEDAKALRELPEVLYVAESVNTRSQVIYGNANWNTQIEGTNVDLPSIRSWQPMYGSFFSEEDVRAAAKVCVLGINVSEQLFGEGVDPTDTQIRVKNQIFRILGVMSRKGASPGQNNDDQIFAPYTTVMKKLSGQQNLNRIFVTARSAEDVEGAQASILNEMRLRHELAPGDPDDVQVQTQDDIVAIRTQASSTMTSLLAGIAGVSLVVGGIGIMNIMLVSVTERTREIGLRLAIGARSSDVLLQFLIEAVVISLFGGSIGIALGYGASQLLTYYNPNLPTLVPINAVLISVFFSGAVGIFFGFYPARKAAGLDPIEALRFE